MNSVSFILCAVESGLVIRQVILASTRPDSNEHNIKLTEFTRDSKGLFVSKSFSLPFYGRWKAMYKINIGDVQKFISVETFIDPKK